MVYECLYYVTTSYVIVVFVVSVLGRVLTRYLRFIDLDYVVPFTFVDVTVLQLYFLFY